MSIKVDFQELQNMCERFKGANVDKLYTDILNELGNKLLRKTVRRTPKKTGHLKKMWHLSGVIKTKHVYKIILANNVEYAPYVEFGHRKRGGKGWVEGRFMLRASEEEIKQIMNSVINKHLKKFYDNLLGGK